jgi:hypothetical protein
MRFQYTAPADAMSKFEMCDDVKNQIEDAIQAKAMQPTEPTCGPPSK